MANGKSLAQFIQEMFSLNKEVYMKKIEEDISNFFNNSKSEFKDWFKDHLIKPRIIKLKDCDGNEKTLWLVTDHNSKNDSNYRIVYCELDNSYGLEMTDAANGDQLFLGFYGELEDTIASI
jgi:hypothetical protein